jgi:hypothetical protein
MDDGQDPFLTGDDFLQLPHKLEVVLEDLADLQHLLLAGEDAVPEGAGEFDVEEGHGVIDHVAGEGVGEVVGGGVVIVEHLVLLQDLLVLLLVLLAPLRPALEELDDLGGLDFVDLMSWVSLKYFL